MGLDDEEDRLHPGPMPLARAIAAVTDGWTQVRLAKAAEMSQERISRILSGARNARPTLEQLERIEDAVGRPRGFILTLAGYCTAEGATAGEVWLKEQPAFEADAQIRDLEQDLRNNVVDEFLLAADTGTQNETEGPERRPEPPADQDDV